MSYRKVRRTANLLESRRAERDNWALDDLAVALDELGS